MSRPKTGKKLESTNQRQPTHILRFNEENEIKNNIANNQTTQPRKVLAPLHMVQLEYQSFTSNTEKKASKEKSSIIIHSLTFKPCVRNENNNLNQIVFTSKGPVEVHNNPTTTLKKEIHYSKLEQQKQKNFPPEQYKRTKKLHYFPNTKLEAIIARRLKRIKEKTLELTATQEKLQRAINEHNK
jgi:hypothetical protein